MNINFVGFENISTVPANVDKSTKRIIVSFTTDRDGMTALVSTDIPVGATPPEVVKMLHKLADDVEKRAYKNY